MADIFLHAQHQNLNLVLMIFLFIIHILWSASFCLKDIPNLFRRSCFPKAMLIFIAVDLKVLFMSGIHITGEEKTISPLMPNLQD
jgi:cadmium resistance protein CadD (predicted permease)